MLPLITLACSLLAFILAIVNGVGKGNRPPLWIAVALLALAVLLPRIVSMLI
jgi:hypothetical protein